MKEKEAHNLMYFLWHEGYLKNNVTEDHADYDDIIQLIVSKKITSKFIKDLIYYK